MKVSELVIPIAIPHPDKNKEKKEAPYGRCECGHPFNAGGGCTLCYG